MALICVAAPGSALNVGTLTGAHRGPRSLGRPPGQLLRGPGCRGRAGEGGGEVPGPCPSHWGDPRTIALPWPTRPLRSLTTRGCLEELVAAVW